MPNPDDVINQDLSDPKGKKIGIAEPINIRCFGKQSKCYVLNIDTLRNNFREFLKNPTFDFDIIRGDRDDE